MATRFVTATKNDGAALNALADQVNAIGMVAAAKVNSTITAVTLTAVEIQSGLVVNSANGALALTFPTAALLVAAIPNCQVGSTVQFHVRNDGDNTVTLTAGSGNTISGTATIATTLGQTVIAKVTNATAGAEAVTYYVVFKVAN